MLAESIPRIDELATKSDIAELKAELRHWLIVFFAPLWIGVYGVLAAVVVALLQS